MADMPYEEILTNALKLNPAEQARLLEQVASALHERLAETDETGDPTGLEPYTPEEVAELMRPKKRTPEELEARGLIGGWADMGITDGADWVNEQKRKRRERNKW